MIKPCGKIGAKRWLFLPIAALACQLSAGAPLHAQGIGGRITDSDGRPVGNATLFVRELMMGSAANREGYYELKAAPGTYTCLFQCLGYETQTRTVTVEEEGMRELNITLRAKAYEIEQVTVSNSGEDPAYGIMRRAIAMAPYYMNQVAEYNADVYLKGSLQISRISGLARRMAKEFSDKYREGATYVEESFSEIGFTAPDKYEQRVLKRMGSMPEGGSNSGSAMRLITISTYDPRALSPIISPLSPNAFAHYRFRYEGFVEEENRIINKIKIIPLRKSKQLVSGDIYIAENYWNVHSIDVSGEFILGLDFRLQVNFGEVNENVWMPVSHHIDFNASILGNRGTFQYVSSLKYTRIAENMSIRKPDALLLAEQHRAGQKLQISSPDLPEDEIPANKTGARIEEMLGKESLSNREAYQLARLMRREADTERSENRSLDITDFENYKVTVDSTANRHDTLFWETMRPVPLNPGELKSYRGSEIGLSTVPLPGDTARNRVKSPLLSTTGKILMGTSIKLGERGGMLEYRGLKPSKLGFNTVDGFFIGQKLTYYRDFTGTQYEKRLTVTPEAVWAIDRKAVMWGVNASLTYAPKRRGTVSVNFGETSADYGNPGIHPLENTVSSLFFRRNYMKLYGNSFVEAFNSIDIANGLQLNTMVKYARRVTLDNTSDYSFFYRDLREYTSNIPVNAELASLPTDHTSTIFTLAVNYTPRHYYRIDSYNRKFMVKSDFPTFSVGWQKGVNGLLGSDSDFDHITVGLRQYIETGLMQQLYYSVRAGLFINRKSIFFPDFRHFTTVELPIAFGSISNQSFKLLEYYRYSTSDNYLEAHVNYFTPLLLLKYLPFFSNRLWQEGVQFNYLHTTGIKNYMELGYTIGLGWQAGLFAGFENFGFRSFGAKLSLPLVLSR